MSDLARKQLAAVRQYQAEHPDVDWTTNVVYLRPTERPITAERDWIAVSHQPKDASWDELERCCCHPDQPRGHEL